MSRFTIIYGEKKDFHQNNFHQKLYGAIIKRWIYGGGDNLSASAGIAAAVAVVVSQLRRGGCGATGATVRT